MAAPFTWLLKPKNLELLPNSWVPAKSSVLKLSPSGGQLTGAQKTAPGSMMEVSWESFLKVQSDSSLLHSFQRFCMSLISCIHSLPLKLTRMGAPVVAQWLMNPTRNHEVADLIPALAQWVKDLALP